MADLWHAGTSVGVGQCGLCSRHSYFSEIAPATCWTDSRLNARCWNCQLPFHLECARSLRMSSLPQIDFFGRLCEAWLKILFLLVLVSACFPLLPVKIRSLR